MKVKAQLVYGHRSRFVGKDEDEREVEYLTTEFIEEGRNVVATFVDGALSIVEKIGDEEVEQVFPAWRLYHVTISGDPEDYEGED